MTPLGWLGRKTSIQTNKPRNAWTTKKALTRHQSRRDKERIMTKQAKQWNIRSFWTYKYDEILASNCQITHICIIDHFNIRNKRWFFYIKFYFHAIKTISYNRYSKMPCIISWKCLVHFRPLNIAPVTEECCFLIRWPTLSLYRWHDFCLTICNS